MAKKVKAIVKLNLPGGEATPAQPVGPALGQHGVNLMEFVKGFNDKTSELKGNVIPVIITIFEDRSFTFITKKPPVADAIKKILRLEKGSGVPHREKVGKLSIQQVKELAEQKMEDLNAKNVEAAMEIVKGTARSMGVDIEKK